MSWLVGNEGHEWNRSPCSGAWWILRQFLGWPHMYRFCRVHLYKYNFFAIVSSLSIGGTKMQHYSFATAAAEAPHQYISRELSSGIVNTHTVSAPLNTAIPTAKNVGHLCTCVRLTWVFSQELSGQVQQKWLWRTHTLLRCHLSLSSSKKSSSKTYCHKAGEAPAVPTSESISAADQEGSSLYFAWG